MFDLSVITGIERKSAADILKPIKNMVDEALGHECERFTVELNIEKGEMRIASEGRSETLDIGRAKMALAMKIVTAKMRPVDGRKRTSPPVMGSIFWEKGKVSMAVKTADNEILTNDFL